MNPHWWLLVLVISSRLVENGTGTSQGSSALLSVGRAAQIDEHDGDLLLLPRSGMQKSMNGKPGCREQWD